MPDLKLANDQLMQTCAEITKLTIMTNLTMTPELTVMNDHDKWQTFKQFIFAAQDKQINERRSKAMSNHKQV